MAYLNFHSNLSVANELNACVMLALVVKPTYLMEMDHWEMISLIINTFLIGKQFKVILCDCFKLEVPRKQDILGLSQCKTQEGTFQTPQEKVGILGYWLQCTSIMTSSISLPNHDDDIKCKHFLLYWPLVRGIHWSTVDSPHKGQGCAALMFSLISTLPKAEQTIEMPVIWDAIVLIMMPL